MRTHTHTHTCTCTMYIGWVLVYRARPAHLGACTTYTCRRKGPAKVTFWNATNQNTGTGERDKKQNHGIKLQQCQG
jgi:hypothetical protein